MQSLLKLQYNNNNNNKFIIMVLMKHGIQLTVGEFMKELFLFKAHTHSGRIEILCCVV